jgi:hypothetical protein
MILNQLLLFKCKKNAIFSPEMIWEAVPQCRCSKSERVFTVPCILHIDAGRGPGHVGNASLGSHRHPHASWHNKAENFKIFPCNDIFVNLWKSRSCAIYQLYDFTAASALQCKTFGKLKRIRGDNFFLKWNSRTHFFHFFYIWKEATGWESYTTLLNQNSLSTDKTSWINNTLHRFH